MITLKKFWKNRFLSLASITLVVFSLCFAEMHAQVTRESTLGDQLPSSFEEIKVREAELFENGEFERLEILVNAHLVKAKAEENALETGQAYYYKYAMSNSEKALAYADSIIEITLGSSHPNFPTTGYYLKGHYYYHTGNFESALDSFVQAYELATSKKNIEQQREISLAIAAIRNLNGQHYAAFEMYNKALNFLKNEKDYKKDFYSDYMVLLYNLSLTQLRLKEVDSARIYARQGIELSHFNKDNRNFKDFVLLDAQINFYDKNLLNARDTLEKYVNSLDGTSKAIKFYYLGRIEDDLKNKDQAINYFEKIDSIVAITQDEFPEIKDVYHHLILDAIQRNDKEKQIEYIDKLVFYDSVLSTGQEHILNKSTLALDIPLLKQQKIKVQEQIKAKRRYKFLAGFLGTVTMISCLHFYTKNRKMNRRLHLLLEQEPTRSQFFSDKPLENSAAIPEDIKDDLLFKLEKFENSDRYLDKNLDMSILATELGTNTSYLSQVINNYKGMSFPNYLKELRIAYAINELKKNVDLTKYNNQGLAEFFGFKTGESFSKTFFKKTGVYPSKFIKELKARKEGGQDL